MSNKKQAERMLESQLDIPDFFDKPDDPDKHAIEHDQKCDRELVNSINSIDVMCQWVLMFLGLNFVATALIFAALIGCFS